MKSYALLVLIGLAGFASSCGQTQSPSGQAMANGPAYRRYERVAPKMGTVFHLIMYAPSQAVADAAEQAVWARVDELNAKLSDYDANSELSRLGQLTLNGPMTRPAVVSKDLYTMLDRSVEAAEQSEGTFDITVGPLVQLWRRSRRLEVLPTTQRVAEAKQSVGYKYITLFPEHRGVQLMVPKMRLDVGGIAKGYAAVEMRRVLKEQFGLTQVFCGAAGDIAVGDPPPERKGWTIALDGLDATEDKHGAYITISNYGLSTSGDTERYVVIDGKRYSHIINPATGYGLTDRISVNAVAPDSVVSDWMAAAVCIMGPERGLALAERTPGVAVRITKLVDGKVQVWESSRMKDFLSAPPTNFKTRQPARMF